LLSLRVGMLWKQSENREDGVKDAGSEKGK
jgi:hypothetical protein